eukprot:scaffold6266_cov279-Chaetoceros_neogracile.AAC.5
MHIVYLENLKQILFASTLRRHVSCTYEEVTDDNHSDNQIAPRLFEFLGVDPDHTVKRLIDVVKQSSQDECLKDVIENWDEVERAFCRSDISYFQKRKVNEMPTNDTILPPKSPIVLEGQTWSNLFPICS